MNSLFTFSKASLQHRISRNKKKDKYEIKIINKCNTIIFDK